MSGDTHAAVGAAVGLATAACYPAMITGTLDYAVAGTAASIIGALFADLDLKQSKGSVLLDKVLGVCAIIAILVGGASYLGYVSLAKVDVWSLLAFVVFLAIGLFARTRPHREFSHSFVCMLATTLLVSIFTSGIVWVWYLLGYLSHLIIDVLNGKGESLLWPLDFKFCLKLCSANGVVNKMLRVVALVIAVLAVASMKAGGKI